MVNRLFIYFSFIFFCLSVLNPIHMQPWGGFFSEGFAFIAVLLLSLLLINKKLNIAKVTLPFLFISVLPLFQYVFNQIFFSSNAILSSIYIFSFWLMIIIGYNLSLGENKAQLNFNFTVFMAYFLFISGLFSALFALFQWLNVYKTFQVIMEFSGSRPYANMAQPNHLATFFNLAIFSSWYIYEKEKIGFPILINSSLFFIFGIALTQSRTGFLILFSSFLIVFFFKARLSLKINKKYLSICLVYFICIIYFLPKLRNLLSYYFDIKEVTSAIERATTGYNRLDIWNQMIHAIMEKPWSGYGWNQTTFAQFSVIDRYHSKEWATSAHNLILDILVWGGLPVGIFIIVYFSLFFLYLFKNILSLESFFPFLVVSSLIFHSLLEYPLYYSYFLLPFGLFCGIALSEIKCKIYSINSLILKFLFFLSVTAFIGISREYFKVEDNLFSGRLHAMGNLKTEVELPHHLYFFDNFEARARWLGLYPKTHIQYQKLKNSEKIIKTSLKPYDIYKYAQLMAYNGNSNEALKMLNILETMYGMNISYEELIEEHKNKIDHQ